MKPAHDHPRSALRSPLHALEPIARPSIADAVFDELHRQILTLDMPPGTRLSETDVARALDVSRQPVRDAFYRLSKLGFLSIRPQRATTVAPISERAVAQASFIRAAIEADTVRHACTTLTGADADALGALIERQRTAVMAGDAMGFHALDDEFHRQICERSGHGFAWEIIRENKAQMDRVRFLSLSFASGHALADHQAILDAVRARDSAAATRHMRLHLSRIEDQIVRVRAEHSRHFAPDQRAPQPLAAEP